MHPLSIFAIGFLGIGMFLLGIYAGEQNIIRNDHASNRLRSQYDGNAWWMVGVVAIVAAIVLAVVAANPAEKLIERANKISSLVNAETTVH